MSRCGAQYIALPWAFHGGNNLMAIWRLNADGSHAMQLTDGKDDTLGWSGMFRQSRLGLFRDDTEQVWRVRLNADEAGKAEPVPGSAVAHAFLTGRGMDISPDGKTLAYLVEFIKSGVCEPARRK